MSTSASTSKVYLITGANRGIGFSIAKVLAATPSNTILATARDPARATELNDLAAKGNVHVLTLDIGSESSIEALTSQLEKYAKDGIDYFISNAGIAEHGAMHPALEVGVNVWNHHFKINTVGPILVTQKVVPFLLKKDTRVAFYVSSLVGSMGTFFKFSSSAYGLSKAGLNYFTKVLSFELESQGFTVVAIHPGVVASDMGNEAARLIEDPEVKKSFESMTISTEESATKQVELLLKLTKEDNGKFLSYTGDELSF